MIVIAINADTLGPSQSTAHQHGKHCEITDTAQIVSAGFLL
jgi:hypothetical protein